MLTLHNGHQILPERRKEMLFEPLGSLGVLPQETKLPLRKFRAFAAANDLHPDTRLDVGRTWRRAHWDVFGGRLAEGELLLELFPHPQRWILGDKLAARC